MIDLSQSRGARSLLFAITGAALGAGLSLLVVHGLPAETDSTVIDLRGTALPPSLSLFGLGAERYVRPESAGLRMTLPANRDTLVPVGVSLDIALTGDFDISTSFEILNAEAPRTGYGAGVMMALNQTMRVGRLTRPENEQVIIWDQNVGRVGGKVKMVGEAKACRTNSGRLRLSRRAGNLRFQWAPPEAATDFQDLHVAEEETGINQIKLIASTGRQPSALDVRFLELRIANHANKVGAQAFSWLPAAALGAVLGGLAVLLLLSSRKVSQAPEGKAVR